MEKNASEIIDYKEEHGTIATMYYFYLKVDDGCSWDIKNQNEWLFEEGKYYVFDGMILRYDDLGNMNFGYVGAILFPEEVLCFGAAITQGTVLCVDKNKQNLLKYCRGESNAKASKNNE